MIDVNQSMPTDAEDITPENSFAPVYLVAVRDSVDDIVSPAHLMEQQIEARESGLAKLIALGLTKTEASAITGI